MRFVIIALFICMADCVCAQQNTISIHFIPQFNTVPIEMGKKYPYKNDSIEIETLKFYISHIKLYHDEELIEDLEKKHFLIDINNPASQTIYHTNNKNATFNRLVFNIGVDSATNESGAYGGDLDPTKGMYWEWRSGYINFKLEGKSSICPARKNQFTFHIGGYQYPFNTIKGIDLPLADNKKIVVAFDVDTLLNQINISELYEVMSPNEKAMGIANKIAVAFNIAK